VYIWYSGDREGMSVATIRAEAEADVLMPGEAMRGEVQCGGEGGRAEDRQGRAGKCQRQTAGLRQRQLCSCQVTVSAASKHTSDGPTQCACLCPCDSDASVQQP
jgi:hypothetical protein